MTSALLGVDSNVVVEVADLRFAWMGGLAPGDRRSYRVGGRSFLVEYDDIQDGAKHVHSVWRDLEGVWGEGEDLLARHHRTAQHHRQGSGR